MKIPLTNTKLLGSFIVVLMIAALLSCSSTKQSTEEAIYGPTWELEYLSGPGTELSTYFEADLPYFQFDKKELRVFGSTGCNGYNAGFTIVGSNLKFGQPGISTLRYCGEGENQFRRAMQEVNHWSISEDGKLFLYKGDAPLMRFKKK